MINDTCHSGKKIEYVQQHCLSAFAAKGVPQTIKTDTGPSHVSKALSSFFRLWYIKHLMGIPYNPHGQAKVGHAYLSLKTQLQKQKGRVQLPP